MEYKYSLSMTPFSVVDIDNVINKLTVVAPKIAEYIECSCSNKIAFDPEESWAAWDNEEEDVIEVIINFIVPGDYCIVRWEDNTGLKGGQIVVSGKSLPIGYAPVVMMPNKNGYLNGMDLESAAIILKKQSLEGKT